MNQGNDVVIYDQWPNMTIFFIREVVFVALDEVIQIDRLLFVEGRKENRRFCKDLWLADSQFSYAGAQRATVEPKDFCSQVFATHFPIGLLKYVVHLHRFFDLFKFFRLMVFF